MIHPKLNLTQGKNCSLHPQAYIGFNESGKGYINLKDKVTIRHGCVIRTCSGGIIIGNNTVINYNCILHALGSIVIGSNVLISPNVQMYAQNHGIKKGSLIGKQPQTGKGINICNDVWIGAGAIICDGVTINQGAIIGAGSIVTAEYVYENEIWAGNPARKIGDRK